MKQLSFKSILFMFAGFVFANSAYTQIPTYQLYVTNEVLSDPQNYQFDIFLLRTGSTPLELATVQFGLGFNASIVNGGTLSASIAGNSELLPWQVPTTVMIGNSLQTQMAGGITYRFFDCAAQAPSGSGTGTIISNVNSGCNHPGTRVATFRLTNSVPFAANTHCNHIFSTSPGSGRTNTLVNAYVAQSNTSVTNTANHLGYNSVPTCDQNIALNNCVAPSVSETHINATCSTKTGSIDVTVSGSSGLCTYLWNDGNTNEDRNKLKAATYTVTVTNNTGCKTIKIITIQSSPMEPKIAVDNKISCFGSCDGIMRATGITGTAPYTYIWSNGGNNNMIEHLCSGTYTLTVMDSKGCTGTVLKILSQPSAIVPKCAKTEITSKGANDGTITWQTHGGTAPYSYLWSDGNSTGNRSNISPGTYTITITDSHGCRATVTKKWKNSTARMADGIDDITLNIFPNPSNGIFTLEIDAASAGHYIVKILDIENRLIVSKDYELEEGVQQITMDLMTLPKGVYLLDVSGNEIKEIQKLILQ